MISFTPSEDQSLVLSTVAELAKTSLAPAVREHEAAGGVTDALRRSTHELGLHLAAVPESHGGQGLGLVTACLINEELAVGDAAGTFDLVGFGPFAQAVLELAPAARAMELLGALGTDAAADGAFCFSELSVNAERAGMKTTATRADGGYRIDGEKCFVLGAARAKWLVVIAQLDPAAGWGGLGAFLVSTSATGVTVGARHATLGLGAAHFATVRFQNVQVAEGDRWQPEGDFTRALLRVFAKYGLLVAARQTGLARSAFDIAREYADVRKAFGKPIGHFQAVAFTLADRLMDAESANALVVRAAWAWDAGKDEAEALTYTAQAIAHADEAAMRAADDCVQLHGGAGFIRDLVAEMLMRDAKQMALVGLTAEQADQIASAIELGTPLDPALVLPTPDTQAVFT